MPTPLAVIGGGNMAGAILARAEQAGVLEGGFVVAEPDAARRAAFANGVASATEALEWLAANESTPGSGRVLLAIKPQVLTRVAAELAPVVATDRWGGSRSVISILAGARAATIAAAFGGRARVLRVMPNTPALVGRGMAALSASPTATPDDIAFTLALFEAVGTVIEIDESRMDAFTALAGSGPAYVFLLAEAMAAAGQAAGLEADDALLAARQTIAGAGLLLAQSAEHPSTLRERVTSPGGTTAAALAVFEDSGLRDITRRAIIAARDRGEELARLTER